MPDDRTYEINFVEKSTGDGSKKAAEGIKAVTKAQQEATEATVEAAKKDETLNVTKRDLLGNLKALKSEIPMLGSAIRIFSNPITLLGAGLGWLIGQIKKTRDEIGALYEAGGTFGENRLAGNVEATAAALKVYLDEVKGGMAELEAAFKAQIQHIEKMQTAAGKLGGEGKMAGTVEQQINAIQQGGFGAMSMVQLANEMQFESPEAKRALAAAQGFQTRRWEKQLELDAVQAKLNEAQKPFSLYTGSDIGRLQEVESRLIGEIGGYDKAAISARGRAEELVPGARNLADLDRITTERRSAAGAELTRRGQAINQIRGDAANRAEIGEATRLSGLVQQRDKNSTELDRVLQQLVKSQGDTYGILMDRVNQLIMQNGLLQRQIDAGKSKL